MKSTTGQPAMPLATEFVRIKVPLQTSGLCLRDKIETTLQTYGEPLRWAITAMEGDMAQVEAVITPMSSERPS
ncbi:MAG: hypothetical protein AAGA46_14930 [Cyanobacteria bacterium P01_F01_bin.13]